MKRVLKILYSALLSFVMLFSVASCDDEKTSTMKCAPCTVGDIFSWNEEVYQEFFYLRMMTMTSTREKVKCTVNGEEWTTLQQVMEELPEGKYTIVFYTPKDFKIEVRKNENGEWVQKEVPYVRKATVEVEISSKYGDICDYEYRKANGLWVDPATRDWYDDCMAEVDELYK